MDLKYYKSHYCSDIENVENFEKAKADNFKNWCCHHRLQTWTSDGERRPVDITAAELKALNMYYNRPASELIFLTESEHSSLHTKGKQSHRKGKQGYWKGKTGPNKGKQFSAETRNKMSEKAKGRLHTEETKKKISKAKKGENHPMYGKHHSDEARNKIGKAMKGNTNTKGMLWFNNGKINIMSKECPDGFTPGRLRK